MSLRHNARSDRKLGIYNEAIRRRVRQRSSRKVIWQDDAFGGSNHQPRENGENARSFL